MVLQKPTWSSLQTRCKPRLSLDGTRQILHVCDAAGNIIDGGCGLPEDALEDVYQRLMAWSADIFVISTDLTGDLFVEIPRISPVYLDIQHDASNTSAIESGRQT